MSSDLSFVEFVCDQIRDCGAIRFRKMFGEYMVYVNDKPLILVCDNTAYVKKLDCIAERMGGAECGFPYPGAKLHYILDVDDADFCTETLRVLEANTPLPKPKKKK